jgi:hypothetical protein
VTVARLPRPIDGCTKPRQRRALCWAHYYRLLRHGSVTYAERISPNEAQANLELLLTRETDDCVLWPHSRHGFGYGQIRGPAAAKASTGLVHIIACTRRHGPRPSPQHQVAHSCGNPPCMNYRHLRWATRAENEADKILHGTATRGERSPVRKLGAGEVREIRRLAIEGRLTQRAIGAMFGVSQSSVSLIARRINWATLEDAA